MKSVDSKLLLGLVVGAAVGAAVGYLAATDKREQLLEELNSVVGKVKEGFNSALAKYKEGKQEAVQATEGTVTE
ncbi:YtxH domain-containing protein [Parabacteroides sp. ZJ-118]|uniref:YtxH domain-containing protein n=1 Tax=Parabacteroides sp. ZJ-118 TaxID=2709398 RepID=UPI0013EDD2A2|nr:YtxH domain-containing protein [Parabacteroides sp. ZJ-118]